MNIGFVVPFLYKWGNYSNVKSHVEILKQKGYKIILFNKHKQKNIPYNNFDLIMLHGSGTYISNEEYKKIKVPVISFGWSDPNLYSEEHMINCNLYCTNDLQTYKKISKIKPVYYHQTACDQRYHKNLKLEKTTDILVYGIGKHPFVPNRNKIVNNLRDNGFKIKVFGRTWDTHPDTYKFIEGQLFIEEINKAKLVLDITNETTALGHRIFESSACGTPVVTRFREDVSLLFADKSEIIMYNDFDDLVPILDYYLRHPNLLHIIGQNAQNRCYNNHDITNRINKLLTYLEVIL